jgi:hypothetical protein
MQRIPIIDSHTGGEPTRVVLGGVTADDLEKYRRAIICEPRGHEVIVGALLVEPKDASCAAGVIFFNNVGLLGMCGHGMIGLITAGEHRVETPVRIATADVTHRHRWSLGSAITHAQALKGHLLIAHGTGDDNVNHQSWRSSSTSSSQKTQPSPSCPTPIATTPSIRGKAPRGIFTVSSPSICKRT